MLLGASESIDALGDLYHLCHLVVRAFPVTFGSFLGLTIGLSLRLFLSASVANFRSGPAFVHF